MKNKIEKIKTRTNDAILSDLIFTVNKIIDSLTEKGLSIECKESKCNGDCKWVPLSFGGMKCIPDPKCPLHNHKPEPEKTAESEWEKEWRFAESEQCVRANIDHNRSDSVKNIMAHFGTKIRFLLASHTEQKKEELAKKVNKLLDYGDMWSGTTVRLEDVLLLIKEI